MKAILIAAVATLTVFTFYIGMTLASSNAEAIAASQTEQKLAASAVALSDMRAELTAEITEQANINAGLRAEMDAQEQAIVALTAERGSLEGELEEARSEIVTVTALANSQIAQLSQAHSAVAGLEEQLLDSTSQLRDATAQLVTLESKMQDTESALVFARRQLGERNALLSTRDAELTAANATLAARNNTIGAQHRQMRALAAAQSMLKEKADIAATVASQEIARLGAMVDDQTTTVATLEAELATAEQNEEAAKPAVVDLEAAVSRSLYAAENAEAKNQIDMLNSTIAAQDARIAQLTAMVVALTEQAPQASVSKLSFENSTVTLAPEQLAALCTERVTNVLAASQIQFRIGTAAFDRNSIATLEDIRGLAQECQSPDLVIKIGAHTDSLGIDANNQVLTERRAQAVKAFLVEDGIPADVMFARGFGETRPIAPNQTNEGRVANRRITIEWQVRDTGFGSLEEAASASFAR